MTKGGAFLIETVKPEDIFTPEDFSEEHLMVAKTVTDFVNDVVLPRTEAIEAKDFGVLRDLIRQAGELGFLGVDVPEEYGGEGLDKITSMIVGERMAPAGSFAVALLAHTGIGTLPVVYFGNEEQKKRYLPGMARGTLIAAYALTEPGAGSDALNAKTRAVLSEDGQYYILNGTKQFITNAGFADVFITFARVDGEKFTAFIVDRDTPGVTIGPEEKKMGLDGSSTCPVIFEDARVPVANVLGEIGRGHLVALNVLDIGRLKLGAACAGSGKAVLEIAAKYALQREQFGRPIARFGLIQEKLGRMAAHAYAVESSVYRTTGDIEERLAGVAAEEVARAITEYAVECSINKVYGSEALDYILDEAVQIHGGYGYIKEYAVERYYRDARINRIFEGTNEINRLLIPGTLLRRAMKGELALLAAAQRLAKEVLELTPSMPDEDVPLAAEAAMVEAAKKVFLLVGGTAAQKFMDKIQEEQEILAALADLVIAIYTMESVVLRAKKALARGPAEEHVALAQAYVYEVFPVVELRAREALAATLEGDELLTQLAVVRRLARYRPANIVGLRRKIAGRVLELERYPF
ncbi:MAG: acyl-CoA dehydrogenase family protein [Desulfotomaculales bacterium]